MKIPLETTHWSTIINIILQKYFADLTTTCILWHHDFDFQLQSTIDSNVFLQINNLSLSESFVRDIHNYSKQDEFYRNNGVYYSDLVKKYVAAIEKSNCEGFLAFQDDIPLFTEEFRKASVYSIWRSTSTRFLFVYAKENCREDYFKGQLFIDQANILIIEADFMNSSIFALKTNKFVGSLHNHPKELKLLAHFNALNHSFLPPNIDLFSKDKLQNLQGREVITGVFDYRPFVAVDFQRLPQYYDQAEDNPSHLVHVDGSEIRITMTFCEIYNCTVQFDSSEKEEWGASFANYSGYGLMGMIIEGKINIAMGGMYGWYSDYMVMDMTHTIGRSGMTCLVPAPKRLISWDLPLRPFQAYLWLAVLACLCVEAIVLVLSRYFEHFLENTQQSWKNCFEFGYTTTLKLFISQSSYYRVSSHTVRVVLFACYMIDIIITSIYGGGLSAVLTLPTLDEAADSVERLYKFNLPWLAPSYVFVESIVHGDTPILKHFVKKFEIHPFEELRTIAETENVAFAIEHLVYGHFANLQFITQESLKRFKLMVDDIYFSQTVVSVNRLWAHLPKYNDFILAWRSSGFDKYWEWKITADYLNINEQNQVEASKSANLDIGPIVLSMDNFCGLIVIWLLGMAASVLAFLGELALYHLKRKRKMKLLDKKRKN